MIGQTISHYKVLEKLGEGGMGVVYKAQDLKLKRIVALKFLPNDKFVEERDRARFLHEAQAAAALDHPNICAVHEIVETDEYVFIVMSYIAGHTLQELAKSEPLEMNSAIDYAIQIAEGLKAAHASKIIHRDIKSANVIVTNVGGAKITDFGLARIQDQTRLTQSETTMGTAPYMSPEQVRGGEVDHQTDIWSLGVVLYEMLAGRLPFRGANDAAVINSILNEEPKPLSSIRPDTPVAVDQIVKKSLAKNWDDRYHTTEAILADLRKVQNALRTGVELPVAAAAVAPKKGPGLVSRLAKSKWVKSRVTWGVAAAVVVIVVGIILLNPNPAVPFGERDWVLIADFENFTGENVFDKTLDVALAVSLGQSQYVNVFPRRRTEDALRRMKKSDIGRIDEGTAREIAVREGVKVFVVPTIGKIGDTYTLTGKIQDSETGENLRMEMVKAEEQYEVLDALDELAKMIRGHLGEAGRSISLRSEPLEKVTTSSLGGLKQYSLGFERHQEGRFEEAKRYYEYSLQRDSTFAIALGALGILEYLHFNKERGVELLNRSLEYADEATEREGYALRAGHAIAVEQDYEKAAKIYEMSVVEYPDASTYRNNLATMYSYLGRNQDAAGQYKEAIRADPTLMIAYNGLVTVYLENLGRVDSAMVWLDRQMQYDPQSSWPYYNLAYAYIGMDSLDLALAALERSLEIDGEFVEGLELIGHVLRLKGRYTQSLNALNRQLTADPDAVEPHYYMGVVYRSAGNNGRARDSFDRFRQITRWRLEDEPESAEYLVDLGLVLTRTGQPQGARAAIERAVAADTTAHFEFARLYSVLGRTDESLDQLQRAVDAGYRNLIVVKYHPDFQSLRKDPRLAQFLGRYLKI